MVSRNNTVQGIGRHDAQDTRAVRDPHPGQDAGPLTGDDIMDLHLAGMGVVANLAARIDPDMVYAHPAPCFAAGHKVP